MKTRTMAGEKVTVGEATDQGMRLCIEKRRRNLRALYTFNLLAEGYSLLRNLVAEFDLSPKLCFLQSANIRCQALAVNKCNGRCEQRETPEAYNRKVLNCIEHIETELPTFALLDNGLTEEEQSCVLIEKGKFYGMGCLPSDVNIHEVDKLKDYLTPYAENDYIRRIVFQYAERFPANKFEIAADAYQN